MSPNTEPLIFARLADYASGLRTREPRPMHARRRARPGGLDGGDDSSGVLTARATLFSLRSAQKWHRLSFADPVRPESRRRRSGSHQWLCGTPTIG